VVKNVEIPIKQIQNRRAAADKITQIILEHGIPDEEITVILMQVAIDVATIRQPLTKSEQENKAQELLV